MCHIVFLPPVGRSDLGPRRGAKGVSHSARVALRAPSTRDLMYSAGLVITQFGAIVEASSVGG